MASSLEEQDASLQPAAQPNSGGSYGQILKTSALIGGTSVLNIVVGVARSKAIALILGPSGVGLNGIYTSITGLAETLAGMGINNSGVRQMAEATGSGDQERVSRTAAVLRKTSLALGLLGAAVLIAFSRQISEASFGDASQTLMISILAASVLFRTLSAGQSALLQGLRRMPDLARVSVLTTLGATLVTIPLVYFLGQTGIAVSVAAGSALGLAASWWFSRRMAVGAPKIGLREVRSEAGELLHMGAALMVSGLVTTGCSYLIRTAIFRQLGADASGLYGAAFMLGGTYVGFILAAMGSDFFPRLTASAHDNSECNRLVNEQAHVSLLLAGTGVIGTLGFAPLVLYVFYASEFAGAVEVLRWICLGTALQVVSWPMGFVMVAKGQKAVLVWSEAAWAAVHLGLAWFGMRMFGLNGAGMAFFGSYVFHVGLTYAMARRLTGFGWSPANGRATAQYLLMIGAVFGAVQLLPQALGMGLSAVAMMVCGIYSLRTLAALSPESVPVKIRRWMGHIGMEAAL